MRWCFIFSLAWEEVAPWIGIACFQLSLGDQVASACKPHNKSGNIVMSFRQVEEGCMLNGRLYSSNVTFWQSLGGA